MENGKWKMEDGRWKMEDGRWKMEDGRWKMEKGGASVVGECRLFNKECRKRRCGDAAEPP